jgi:hypothetical protein
VSRLRKFTAKASDVPESFSTLSTRLPLLITTLQRLTTQAQASRLPKDVIEALQAVIDGTSTKVSTVQACLSGTIPPENASKLERALKALKSLAKEDKVRQAVEKRHKDVDFLVLHQKTRHIDMGDHIQEELSKLMLTQVAEFQSFGVCLGQAPHIDPDAFIGRTTELQKLRDIPLTDPASLSSMYHRRLWHGRGGQDATEPGARPRLRRRVFVGVLGEREG